MGINFKFLPAFLAALALTLLVDTRRPPRAKPSRPLPPQPAAAAAPVRHADVALVARREPAAEAGPGGW